MPYSSRGMNEPSIYMHCWGLNLRGQILHNYVGKEGTDWLVFGWLYCGALCQALEYFIL